MGRDSDLSLDRTFYILGSGELPVAPEKIIIYGALFIGIVMFVNWILSITVFIMKPFLYAALMLAVLRPELLQSLSAEESLRTSIEAGRSFINSLVVNAVDFFQLLWSKFGGGQPT